MRPRYGLYPASYSPSWGKQIFRKIKILSQRQRIMVLSFRSFPGESNISARSFQEPFEKDQKVVFIWPFL